jgi:DNA-binding CsgD family transcriptional regulator
MKPFPVNYAIFPERRTDDLRRKFTFSQPLSRSLQMLSQSEARPVEVLAEELLAYAVEQKQAAQRYWRCWNSLSRRQKEVVVLISRGYSNYEIARSLVISVETAKTHVRNILYKFNLHRREQLRTALASWDFRDWEYLG